MSLTDERAIALKTALYHDAVTHDYVVPGFRIYKRVNGVVTAVPGVGTQCRAMIVTYQTRNKLKVDGTFNQETQDHLIPPPKLTIGEHAVLIAGNELGVKESPAGSNSGPRVRQYQNETNPGTTGFPWCASFVTWCLREAGWTTHFPSQAYVPAWIDAARSGKYPLHVVTNPVRGDIVAYDWQHDGTADHIGFVLSAPVNGSFKAREGNTAVGNDSNGGEVMDRDRSTRDVAAFIRLG